MQYEVKFKRKNSTRFKSVSVIKKVCYTITTVSHVLEHVNLCKFLKYENYNDYHYPDRELLFHKVLHWRW